MSALVAAAGFGLLSLPALTRPLGRRLRPARWAILCLAALASGSALVLLAGLAMSVSTVFQAAGLPRVARACEAMFGHLVPAGALLDWFVLGVTLSALVLGTRSLLRSRRVARRGWVEPSVGSRLPPHPRTEVVVLDAEVPRAFSVPGARRRPGQIVVTRGLLDALTAEELDLVCAHEASHLRLGHGRWLAVTDAVERALWFWPPAHPSCAALRLALERWADETAAGEDPERRSRLCDALVTVAADGRRPVLAAFSTLDGLVERLVAMSDPAGATLAVTWWPVLFVPGLVLGVIAVVALAHLGQGVYCLASMPHSCSLR